MPNILRELTSYIQFIVQDFADDTRFWIIAVTTLILAVVGALTFSANIPRLIPVVTSIEAKYIAAENNHQGWSRDEAIDALKKQIQSRLARHLSFALPNDGQSRAVEDDIFREDLGKEKFLSGIGLLELKVALNVTNTAATASSVTRVRVSLVEEVDGQRHPVEQAVDADVNIKIPERQTLAISTELSPKFYFIDGLALIVDYETVRFLYSQLSRVVPSGRDRATALSPYVSMLTLGSKRHEEQLLTLADPRRRCRVLVLVTVYDVFGRPFTAESEMVTSFPSAVPSATR